MKRRTTKNIGIIRGLMPRLTQAEFAFSFKRLQPTFITGGASQEIKNFCKNSGQEILDLNLKPVCLVDPVKLFLGRETHQSWISITKNDLLGACKNLDYIETYELYHFFSGAASDVARELKIPLITEVWTSFLHPAYFLPPYILNTRKVLVKS